MRYKKIFISCSVVLFAVFIMLFCVSSDNMNTVSAQEVDSGYEITSYNVNFNVNENNVFNIVETLAVKYNTYRHGIIRNIPLYYTFNRTNGSKDKCKAKISNLNVNMDSVSAPTKISYMDYNYVIKIGDPHTSINGLHTYTISYDYNFGKDYLEGNDEFFFNIIGTQWNTSIDNVTFSLTMPKDFTYTSETLGFTWGEIGKNYTNHISYNVIDRTISGSFDQKLSPFQGLNINLVLPDNYFVGTSNNYESKYISYTFFLSLACLGITLIVFFIFKKKQQIPTSLSFYAPNNKNSLDIALDYKTKVSSSDVVSMILYFASKGYLEINKLGNCQYELKKKVFLPALNSDESNIWNALFKNSSETTTLTELKNNKFGKEMRKLINKKNTAPYCKDLVNKKSFVYSIIAVILTVVCMVYSQVPLAMEKYLHLRLWLAPFVLSWVVGVVLYTLQRRKEALKSITTILVLFYNICLFPECNHFDISYIFMCIVCCVIELCIAWTILALISRTPDGRKVYGQALGFREFLIRARKDELERLIEKNPNYFYDILPYAYVFGISKKWIKKFDTITIPLPNWYNCSNVNSSTWLNDFFISISFFSSMATKTLYYSSFRSSRGFGSGHSGGGSSGGGGGGGGSSW